MEADSMKIYIYTYKYYPKVSLCYKGYKWCMQVEGMDAID